MMAKTALEQTPKEWQKYNPSKAIAIRRWDKDERVERRWELAHQLAREAARILYETFKAEKVYLFGSLTQRSWFTPWSDVDLAVKNIPQNQFYAAVAAVTSLSSEIKIDLVDLDSCHSELRKVIEQEGVEL